MQTLHDRAVTQIPRCLAGVSVKGTIQGERLVRFELSSHGCTVARIWGYDLAKYNPDYDGDRFFISPLFVQWVGDPEAICILDTQIHGYHGEMDASAKYRGIGDPEPFPCPGCAGELFHPEVEIFYWDAVYDLWEDEPDLDIENYFCEYTLWGTCYQCHLKTLVSSMEQL